MHDCLRRRLVLASGLALAPRLASAQGAWPSQPVRIVVPFAPAARPTSWRARSRPSSAGPSARPFVVDNKPGAGGNIGAARSPRPRPTATRC